MRHLVEIVHCDLTDIPPARSTTKLFFIDLPADEMQKFADAIDAKFAVLSDGNDEAYEVAFTTLDEVDVLTPEAANKWLEAFGEESVFDNDED